MMLCPVALLSVDVDETQQLLIHNFSNLCYEFCAVKRPQRI